MFILTKESSIVTCSEFTHHSSNRKKMSDGSITDQDI